MNTLAHPVIDGIDTDEAFIRLAEQYGTPLPVDGHNVIQSLEVKDKESARPNSLSGRYGTDLFPYHTDAAYEETPPRILLLRAVEGDIDRRTHVIHYSDLITDFTQSEIRRSAWLCDTGKRKFLTTLTFDHDGRCGFRFDLDCMTPANTIAMRIDEVLRKQCLLLRPAGIEWRINRVAVIDNWQTLHARGASSSSERLRKLQRIHVK